MGLGSSLYSTLQKLCPHWTVWWMLSRCISFDHCIHPGPAHCGHIDSSQGSALVQAFDNQPGFFPKQGMKSGNCHMKVSIVRQKPCGSSHLKNLDGSNPQTMLIPFLHQVSWDEESFEGGKSIHINMSAGATFRDPRASRTSCKLLGLDWHWFDNYLVTGNKQEIQMIIFFNSTRAHIIPALDLVCVPGQEVPTSPGARHPKISRVYHLIFNGPTWSKFGRRNVRSILRDILYEKYVVDSLHLFIVAAVSTEARIIKSKLIAHLAEESTNRASIPWWVNVWSYRRVWLLLSNEVHDLLANNCCWGWHLLRWYPILGRAAFWLTRFLTQRAMRMVQKHYQL